MTEDDSVKAVDKQKINGYILKWRDSKVLLGCAFCNDLLKSTSILCKVLQEDDVCVVQAFESIFKVKKSLDKLSTTLEQFPSVEMVLGRLRNEKDGLFDQGVELKHHDRAMDYLTSNYVNWIDSVRTCLKDRISFQDIDLLTHAVTLLATKGWERSDSTSFGYEALDAICDMFQAPLENASVNCSLVQEEWDDMVDYAKKYLNLVQLDYKIIWWKLFNAVDATQWSNILPIIELLFCLPMANGHLERVFSQLKLVKNTRRTSIREDTLDQVLRINVDGPPLSLNGKLLVHWTCG